MEHQVRPEAIALPPTQPIDITEWLRQEQEHEHHASR
jgi:hypothetical protein